MSRSSHEIPHPIVAVLLKHVLPIIPWMRLLLPAIHQEKKWRVKMRQELRVGKTPAATAAVELPCQVVVCQARWMVPRKIPLVASD